MHDIVLKKFDEWTRGLTSKESRIRIFKHTRDIPFLITGINDPENGPVELLRQNRGSCSQKHPLIGIMYEKMGIHVKYASYSFIWNDLDIDQPQNLRELADELPVLYHTSLKAYINDTWILLDATWDPPLKSVGFPVNESWDGIADTINAVRPLKETIHDTVQEKIEYIASKEDYTEKEYLVIEKFFNELNKWLTEVRYGKENSSVT